MTIGRQPLTFHQVDAFTDQVFAGNPAAVYVLDAWPDDQTLAAIAAEHNLSETAFVVPGAGGRHELRWFTPAVEVELCGHATLASAHVLLNEMDRYEAPLTFVTRFAGELGMSASDDRLWLDLPARVAQPVDHDIADVAAALGGEATAWYAATNYLAVFDSAADVAALEPDMRALARYSAQTNLGFIATAPADDGQHDFVSRYFAPGHGVDEDPVTGSAHCTLAPYWAERLGKRELAARQISARGGELLCRVDGDRVHIGGQAVTFATGTTFLDPGTRT
ncbi:PhzF family phenazine biosynthesis protein [Salinisphaera hydrothermalis]|uniref:PhzF family phenazine biosynthesis protein n=1 Tax=Salinisphaera hydrothermalis (strain C41B8) TaxID=1304275 RepID=A0A084IL59_SALHC|nr:PhzF family phenazine biosynthesis protein [Salinisphaera hydrothermalis]KEZ77443.1 PhzF family phenazine biosynthesis protein [Salinisphaera hydrothermalis C41B8]